MKKKYYAWWNYIKEIVQLYPERVCEQLYGVSYWEREAVLAAVTQTERMEGGGARLKIIKMVHWDKTHTLEGAAMSIPCDRATAARWQRRFFEEVARNRGLLD